MIGTGPTDASIKPPLAPTPKPLAMSDLLPPGRAVAGPEPPPPRRRYTSSSDLGHPRGAESRGGGTGAQGPHRSAPTGCSPSDAVVPSPGKSLRLLDLPRTPKPKSPSTENNKRVETFIILGPDPPPSMALPPRARAATDESAGSIGSLLGWGSLSPRLSDGLSERRRGGIESGVGRGDVLTLHSPSSRAGAARYLQSGATSSTDSTPVRTLRGRDLGGGDVPSNVSSALTTPAAGMAYIQSPYVGDSDWESPGSALGIMPLATWGVDLGDGTVVDPSADECSVGVPLAATGSALWEGYSGGEEGSFGGFRSILIPSDPDLDPDPLVVAVASQPRITSTLFDSPVRPLASSQQTLGGNFYAPDWDPRPEGPSAPPPIQPWSGASQSRFSIAVSSGSAAPSWQSPYPSIPAAPVPHYQLAFMIQQQESARRRGRPPMAGRKSAGDHRASSGSAAAAPGGNALAGGAPAGAKLASGVEAAGGQIAASRQATAQLMDRLQLLNSRVQANAWRLSV